MSVGFHKMEKEESHSLRKAEAEQGENASLLGKEEESIKHSERPGERNECWVDGWMDEWVDGGMDGWVNK